MKFQLTLPEKGSTFAKGFGIFAVVVYATAKTLDWLPADADSAKLIDITAAVIGSLLPSLFIRTAAKPTPAAPAVKKPPFNMGSLMLMGVIAVALALALSGCADKRFMFNGTAAVPGVGEVTCEDGVCTPTVSLRTYQLEK